MGFERKYLEFHSFVLRNQVGTDKCMNYRMHCKHLHSCKGMACMDHEIHRIVQYNQQDICR